MLPRVPVLFAFALLLAACAAFAPKFERPTLTVVSINLAGGNLLQQNFRVTLRIHNPNDRTLPVKGLTADLRVSGDEIASGTMDHPFTVSALGDTDFDITIKANMALALLKLQQHGDNRADGIAYDLAGEIALDLPFFRTMTFHQTGSLNL
jgi:LEA14-like dessication related protein